MGYDEECDPVVPAGNRVSCGFNIADEAPCFCKASNLRCISYNPLLPLRRGETPSPLPPPLGGLGGSLFVAGIINPRYIFSRRGASATEEHT